MRKSILASSVLVLLFTNISRAQISFACLSIGGSANETVNAIIQSTDSGYVVAGYTSSFGSAGIDMCVSKLSKNGDLLWTHVIRGGNDDVATSIEQTSDGGYLLGGYTNTVSGFDHDFYLAKLDSNGTLQWDKVVGRFNFDHAQSAHQTYDKGYVLAGRSNSNSIYDYDCYIVKLDSNANFQWSKTIGGSNDDRANGMQTTADSGYVLIGETTSFGSGNNDVYVVKLDSSGNLQWANTIGGTGNDVGASVVQAADGGYVIAGSTNSFSNGVNDVYVIKLDAVGNISWTKTIGGSEHDYGTCIQRTADNGYIVGGFSPSFNGLFTASYFIKLDASGNVAWASTAGSSGDDFCSSIYQTFDGGYIVGSTITPNGATYHDFSVMKLDATGNSCCPDNTGATVGNGGVAISGGVVTDLTATVEEASLLDTLVEATLTTFCITTSTNQEVLHRTFTLFPNPAEDQLMISTEGVIRHGVLQVYNVMGEKILEEEFRNESTHEVNVFNISPGIYVLKLHARMSGDTESYYSEKLIVR